MKEGDEEEEDDDEGEEEEEEEEEESVLVLQDTVQVCDVADGEPEDLNLGELLVRRQGGQQAPQCGEGRVERLEHTGLILVYTSNVCIITLKSV